MGVSIRPGRYGGYGDSDEEDKKEEADPLDAHPQVSDPSISEMSVSKKSDSASTQLFALMISRKRTPLVKVVILNGDEVVFTVTLHKVLLSGFSQSASAGEIAKGAGGSESLSFNFGEITYENGGNTATYAIVDGKMSYNGKELPNYEGRSEEQYLRHQAKQVAKAIEEKEGKDEKDEKAEKH